jgi:hypothetical protein
MLPGNGAIVIISRGRRVGPALLRVHVRSLIAVMCSDVPGFSAFVVEVAQQFDSLLNLVDSSQRRRVARCAEATCAASRER